MIASVRASNKSESLALKELSMLRGLVGQITWAVQGTRPDLDFETFELSTKFRRGVVGDLLRATSENKENQKSCFPILVKQLNGK